MRISKLMASSFAIAGIGVAGVAPIANAEDGGSATITNQTVSAKVRLAGVDRYETSQAVSAATSLDSVLVSDKSPDGLIASLQAANDDKSAVMSPKAPSLGGVNRYESAANVALAGDADAPLVIANGRSDVDILAATSYAANLEANLLLSEPNQLGEYAAKALSELNPENITIIGGTGVVNEQTQTQIEELTGKKVSRIAGDNRYTTALAAAQVMGSHNYLLVNGKNPVDALTLAPLAKRNNASVVLIQTSCVPQTVLGALAGKHLTAIGGTGAIADNFAAKTCEQQAAEEAAAAAKAAAEKAAAEQAAREAAARAANPWGAGTPQGIAYDMLGEYGWGPDQMQPLVNLWNRESGWRTNAGRRGGPYGIPQANPGRKMASAGADWATNPATQIRWGLSYIKGRYGSPAGAWAKFCARGWY
ncbi:MULTISPECIES: cell wall-binding repeat-containing protein [Mobiluncus]|jgi:hypothetical protein|uniref:Putative cell wall binding repeat 2 n=1 Tax=Mobiluncus holmesii ATCC 35242 TaxID=887899 RepID=E6M250_9ACTO|nr:MULTISPECIES: cell wall-binding repeat-containing protein [Mobiluncus]EFU82563.1 putative cell wall binding repeat 2 [Mobiluncus holmesii ATCC 35242]NMW98578.1 hypothetical protein [Mobiluncus curtisii]NMX06079.1 hypothetical protein [Mobiluncus curtisii]STY89058.1 Modifier protein of major autolysin [Mobiluncus holmesii]